MSAPATKAVSPMKSVIHLFVTAVCISTGCGHSEISATSTELTSSACGSIEKQTYFRYGDRGIESRVMDRVYCGVVKLRVIDAFDVEEDTHTRTVLRDRDLDGQFEQRHVRVRPLSESPDERTDDRTTPASEERYVPPAAFSTP
jgi:hypothetical protein